MANFRGLEERNERSARQMARDTRPLGQRVGEFIQEPYVFLPLNITLALAGFFLPIASELFFFIFICFSIFYYTRRNTLPFKIPKIGRLPDYNDCIPGTAIPRESNGIQFFGNEHNTNKELWFTNDDMRTHVLIFGSTGSGKTEALISIAYNSLTQGSGFIYIDGKGDNALYSKVFSMVRYMGRDDDLLLVNFMTGARDIVGAQKTRLSNTMNPFNRGSSSMLSELIVSLMGDSSSGGDGDMWKGRAISFVQALMRILTVMRDEGHLLLDAHTIRNYFILEKLEQIVIDKSFPLDDASPVPLHELPDVVLQPLKMYLDNLPGYVAAKKGNQAGEVREQHGFITMQLTRVFSSLADNYAHIIRASLAEIDFKDVVLNRRILVVLLPALEKSPDELANLGKIIVASIKAMMASGLGDEVEGSYKDVIEKKPTNAPTPYVCIMDEYGYYAVKGFAVVPAQARSLGFSAIFAGQDLPAFQKVSKEEAASIGANTNIKICMKLEDPQETWEFFNKVAGEAYVTNVREFSVNQNSLTHSYMDTKQASVDRKGRIDLLDLKDQREGDFHIFYRSKIIRGRAFYANPKPVSKMQVNQFLPVKKPEEDVLMGLDSVYRGFYSVFYSNEYQVPPISPNSDIEKIANFLNDESNHSPADRALTAMIDLLEEQEEIIEDIIDFEETGEFENYMNLFSFNYLSDEAKILFPEERHEAFKMPLVQKKYLNSILSKVERSMGVSKVKSEKIISDFIQYIDEETVYPESSAPPLQTDELNNKIHQLIGKLQSGKD